MDESLNVDLRIAKWVNLMLIIGFILLVAVSGVIVFRYNRLKENISRGSIATASIVDTKTGRLRKYEVYRFMVSESNRCVFETPDGRIVEFHGNEVNEQ